jgi:hypothetical protein
MTAKLKPITGMRESLEDLIWKRRCSKRCSAVPSGWFQNE